MISCAIVEPLGHRLLAGEQVGLSCGRWPRRSASRVLQGCFRPAAAITASVSVSQTSGCFFSASSTRRKAAGPAGVPHDEGVYADRHNGGRPVGVAVGFARELADVVDPLALEIDRLLLAATDTGPCRRSASGRGSAPAAPAERHRAATAHRSPCRRASSGCPRRRWRRRCRRWA